MHYVKGHMHLARGRISLLKKGKVFLCSPAHAHFFSPPHQIHTSVIFIPPSITPRPSFLMYRLIPTEDEVRDEDRTETGSLEEQHDPRTMSNSPKSRLNSIVNRVKSMVPSFLRRSAQWTPSTYASGRRFPPGRRGQHGGYHHKKKQEYRLDRQFLKRISNILSVLMNRRSTVLWLYIFMTLFCCMNEGIVYYVGTIPSRYYKVLGDKDQAAFFRLLIVSLGTVFLAGFVCTFALGKKTT